jgi:DnaJ-class molecular chaperone
MSLTKNCPECHGAGELVEIERDGRVRTATGTEAMKAIENTRWSYSGVRECRNCAGYGHVDSRTGEI